MCLVNQCNGEESLDAAVCPLHGIGIGRVECAFMLVDQYAVLGQRLVAVAVEFLGKQTFTHAERIGRIHNNQVVFVFHLADKPQAVLIVNMYRGSSRLHAVNGRYSFARCTTSSSISTMSICSMEG